MGEERDKSKRELHVEWNDVVSFVRQLSHDLRNHLNAAELQSAFLNELASDAEMKTEVQRLRGMVSELGSELQRLSTLLAPAKLTTIPYQASEFVEDLQQKIATHFPNERDNVQWNVDLAEGEIEIDPQLLQEACVELFTNAFQHDRAGGPIAVEAKIDSGQLLLTLREPKKEFSGSTEDWGKRPLQKFSHGHYGLGLHRVRSIVEAHGGKLEAGYDSAASSLITTVALPLLTKRK